MYVLNNALSVIHKYCICEFFHDSRLSLTVVLQWNLDSCILHTFKTRIRKNISLEPALLDIVTVTFSRSIWGTYSYYLGEINSDYYVVSCVVGLSLAQTQTKAHSFEQLCIWILIKPSWGALTAGVRNSRNTKWKSINKVKEFKETIIIHFVLHRNLALSKRI